MWLLFKGGDYLRAVTIRGWRFFRSRARIVWLLFEGGVNLRAASIRRNTVVESTIVVRHPHTSFPGLAT